MLRGKWVWCVVPLAMLLIGAGLALGQFRGGRFQPRPPIRRPLPAPRPIQRPPVPRPPLPTPRGLPRSNFFKESIPLIHRNPSLAVARLNRLKPGQALTHAEHKVLFTLSLNNLGALEHSRSSGALSAVIWPAIMRTRMPGPDQNGMVPELSVVHKEQMTAIRLRLEEQVVREGVARITKLGEQKQWSAALRAAQDWLARDREFFEIPFQPRSRQHTELRQVLIELGKLHDRFEQAGRLVSEWRPNEPATWPGFSTKNEKALPAQHGRALKGLIAFEQLRQSATGKAKTSPDVAGLKQHVQDFRAALENLPKGGGRELAFRIQQELAVKAFLEGHVAAARALWPAAGSPEHAQNLLRDMRALATGGGEVTTPPGQGAVPAGPSKGGKPPVPPVGLSPLLPDGPGDGWKPPARGSLRTGLPPLVEAAREADTLRDGITRHFEKQRLDLAPHFLPHLKRLELHAQQLSRQEKIHAAWLELVTAKVGGKLAPVERAVALAPENLDANLEGLVKKLLERRKLDRIDLQLELLRGYLQVRRDGRGNVLASEALRKIGVIINDHIFTEEHIVIWARTQLLAGKELVEIVETLTDVLRSDLIEAPDGIRIGVQLDLIALELQSDLGSIEEAHARQMLKRNTGRTEVAGWVRQQRLIERRKADLERVKAYLDRPPTVEELKRARTLLDKKKDVATVVAALADALSPEKRNVPGGIVEAIRLDEIAEEFDAPLDAFEQERARVLLREGREPRDVAAILTLRRAEDSEAEVQRQFRRLHLFDNRERELALDWLRQGLTVAEILRMLGR